MESSSKVAFVGSVSRPKEENEEFENDLKEFRTTPSLADCLLRFVQCPLFIWECCLVPKLLMDQLPVFCGVLQLIVEGCKIPSMLRGGWMWVVSLSDCL